MAFLICFVLLPFAFLVRFHLDSCFLLLKFFTPSHQLFFLGFPLVYILGSFVMFKGISTVLLNFHPLLEVGLSLFGLIKSLAVHIIATLQTLHDSQNPNLSLKSSPKLVDSQFNRHQNNFWMQGKKSKCYL